MEQGICDLQEILCEWILFNSVKYMIRDILLHAYPCSPLVCPSIPLTCVDNKLSLLHFDGTVRFLGKIYVNIVKIVLTD